MRDVVAWVAKGTCFAEWSLTEVEEGEAEAEAVARKFVLGDEQHLFALADHADSNPPFA